LPSVRHYLLAYAGASIERVLRPQLARHIHAIPLQIDREHHRTLQARQLRHQLPHQPKPDHRHAISQAEIRDAH